MFNIGSQELLVILALVFLLFGPRHIPEVARSLGKGLGEIRRTLQGVEDSVRRSSSELPNFDEVGRRAGRGPEPPAKAAAGAADPAAAQATDPEGASSETPGGQQETTAGSAESGDS